MLFGAQPHAKGRLDGKLGPPATQNRAAVVCTLCGRSEGRPEVKPESEGGPSTEMLTKGAQGRVGNHARARGRAKKVSHNLPLRRCCYCRQAVYCSEACVTADQGCHEEMHALRMLFFRDRRLSFWNAVDFECLDT